MASRIALHADASYQDTDGYWVIAAEENTAGYIRVNAWPTLAEAQRYATDVNSRVGVTDEDRRRILASSMTR
ncbi:MAG: hypothetical protein WAX14_19210 [Rhodococcus sp. (in: high G+C Gram-positive bacteria)]|uniref:hypothetical protein n=1 Tax=Rhodococcus sp. TaxID=1831 RepID=UPI003BB76895